MIDAIKIGGIDYAIIEDASLTDINLCGQIRYLRCIIAILPRIAPASASQILLHEILHGLLTQAGILEQPENTIDALAHGLIQVIRDNPALTEMIRGDA